MNKLHVLVGAFLLLATNTHAQSSFTGTANHKDGYNQELILSLLQKQATATTANKTTTTGNERLISASRYTESSMSTDVALEDTVVFTYSGVYHSQFNYNNMCYYWQNEFSGVPFANGEPYFAENNIGVLYDNATAWSGNMWGGVDTNFTCNNLYNTDGNIKQHTYQHYTDRREADNYFDASGNMVLSDRLDNYVLGSTFGITNRIYREFNSGSHNVIKDSLYIRNAGLWTKFNINEYTYNSLENITHIISYSETSTDIWDTASKYDIDYNSSNKMQKVTYYTRDTGGVLQLSAIDSFGWTSGVDYFTYHEVRQYYGGIAQDRFTMSKHISPTNQLPDSTVTDQVYYATSFNEHYLSIFSYNSNNNPVSEHCYRTAPGISNQIFYINSYRYEPYAATEVSSITDNYVGMTAYPNPATDVVNVSFNGLISSAIHLKLINTLGQVVIDKEIDGQNTTQLSLANVQSGVYRLVVEDEVSHATYSQAVIKQ